MEAAAQGVLNARSNHPTSTFENLYDPDLMPPDLRRAHQKLDAETDRLYKRELPPLGLSGILCVGCDLRVRGWVLRAGGGSCLWVIGICWLCWWERLPVRR